MTVFETDQWSASEVTKQGITAAQADANPHLTGEGPATARAMFAGGSLRRRVVSNTDTPRTGAVWFRAIGPDGRLEVYKTRYDSSD